MLKMLSTVLMGMFLVTSHSFADGDSSADAPARFGQAIGQANGVILRVPINENGEENTDAAEVRFYDGEAPQASELSQAWNNALSVDKDDLSFRGESGPQIDPRTDSSTWGWYYWYYRGWARPFYYYYYYPTYYYNYNWYYYYPYYYWNWNRYRYYYYGW